MNATIVALLKPNSIMLAGSKLVTDRFEPASNQLA